MKQERVKEIMGDSFETVQETATRFGIKATSDEINAEVPYSEGTLVKLKNIGFRLAPDLLEHVAKKRRNGLKWDIKPKR